MPRHNNLIWVIYRALATSKDKGRNFPSDFFSPSPFPTVSNGIPRGNTAPNARIRREERDERVPIRRRFGINPTKAETKDRGANRRISDRLNYGVPFRIRALNYWLESWRIGLESRLAINFRAARL